MGVPHKTVVLLRYETLEQMEDGTVGQNCIDSGKQIIVIEAATAEECQEKTKKWMEQIQNLANST